MAEKYLGKIESVEFGFVPDREFLFGLRLSFRMGGMGTCWSDTVNISDACKWEYTEERNKAITDMVDRLAKVMEVAGVTEVSKLKNIPVEVKFEDGWCKGFRVLTEVL